MSWKTIIVGYDQTEPADRALERAVEIAQAGRASLIVTSIAPVLPSGAAAHGIGPFDPANPPEEHVAELKHARELLAGRSVTAEFDLEAGDPSEAIVALARRREADLIVVGTHEPGFLERLVHGSVSQAVSRHAPCDVLIVH